MAIPVYMFTGFLESGKTQFIIDTLLDPGFTEDEKTLIVACEDGEIPYDEAFLKETNSAVLWVESPEDFNEINLMRALKNEKAERVILEYNGMWDIQMVYQNLPPGWDLYQTVTTINAETYELYLKNFGSKVIQQVGISELVIFNRCTPTLKEYIRSTNVVAMNPRAIIFLEDHDGDSENYTENLTLPYDITSDTIQLEDHDFGTFYVDITQDPSRYHGKTVKTKALVHKLTNQDSAYHDSNRFSAGRFAMVCCADDITYISVFCDMPQADKIVQERSWADITAYIDLEFNEQLQEEMAVLKITAYAPAEPPKDDLIYFR